MKKDKSKEAHYKAVKKCLSYMETNLRHPSLQTHEFHGLKGPNGEKVYEAYAQNQRPGAYRILWSYGKEKNTIAVWTIVPHPD